MPSQDLVSRQEKQKSSAVLKKSTFTFNKFINNMKLNHGRTRAGKIIFLFIQLVSKVWNLLPWDVVLVRASHRSPRDQWLIFICLLAYILIYFSNLIILVGSTCLWRASDEKLVSFLAQLVRHCENTWLNQMDQESETAGHRLCSYESSISLRTC